MMFFMISSVPPARRRAGEYSSASSKMPATRHRFAHRGAGHADHVEAVGHDVLQLVRGHDLDDRRFRTRRLALGQRRDAAKLGVFQALGAGVELRQLFLHRGVVDRRAVFQFDRLAPGETVHQRPGPGASRMPCRSFISVVSATFQPAPTGPTRRLSGMRTSVKKTSLKCDDPETCLIGRTSMPGVFMSRMKKVRPSCFGTSGLLRATRMPKSL